MCNYNDAVANYSVSAQERVLRNQPRSARQVAHAVQPEKYEACRHSGRAGIRDRGDSAQGENAAAGLGGRDAHPLGPRLADATAATTSVHHEESLTPSSTYSPPGSRSTRHGSDRTIEQLSKAVIRAEAEAAAARASQRRTESTLHQQIHATKQENEDFRRRIARAATELAHSQAAEADLLKKLSLHDAEMKGSHAQLQQSSAALQSAKTAAKQHKQRERELRSQNQKLQAELLSASRDLEALRAHVAAVKATLVSRPTPPTVQKAAQEPASSVDLQLHPPANRASNSRETELRGQPVIDSSNEARLHASSGLPQARAPASLAQIDDSVAPVARHTQIPAALMIGPLVTECQARCDPECSSNLRNPSAKQGIPDIQENENIEQAQVPRVSQVLSAVLGPGDPSWHAGGMAANDQAEKAEVAVQVSRIYIGVGSETTDVCLQVGCHAQNDISVQCYVKADAIDSATQCTHDAPNLTQAHDPIEVRPQVPVTQGDSHGFDCGHDAVSCLATTVHACGADACAAPLQTEGGVELREFEQCQHAEKVEEQAALLEQSGGWIGLAALHAAAVAASNAARLADGPCVSQLIAHMAFMTEHVADILQRRPATGALMHQRPAGQATSHRSGAASASATEGPSVHALNTMNDRLAAENAQLIREMARIRAGQPMPLPIHAAKEREDRCGAAAASSDRCTGQALAAAATMEVARVETRRRSGLHGFPEDHEAGKWQDLPAVLGGGQWQGLLQDTISMVHALDGVAVATQAGHDNDRDSQHAHHSASTLVNLAISIPGRDLSGGHLVGNKAREAGSHSAAGERCANPPDAAAGAGDHVAVTCSAGLKAAELAHQHGSSDGRDGDVKHALAAWSQGLDAAAAALTCMHGVAHALQAGLAQSVATEAECQSRCSKLAQQCEDLQQQLSQVTTRLHTAERQARRTASGVPAAALRAAARISCDGASTHCSTSHAELPPRAAEDRRPSTSAGALECHAKDAPDSHMPRQSTAGHMHAHESQAKQQLLRLQNALDANRRDAERRDAAFAQAATARGRAEADAAAAREQVRRCEERCAALRQQLTAACSALEAAGLPAPVKGPLDTRASLVREQQHQIKDLEKAAAELQDLLASAKAETAAARQQVARKAKLAERDMQAAAKAAQAHTDSLTSQVEEAEKTLCSTRLELQQAHAETEAIAFQLKKTQQLHATAHQVISALQHKEAAKKTRMVAEHAFNLTYHPSM
eukprot:jgi/Ulvmu1/9202/UM005_0302.1